MFFIQRPVSVSQLKILRHKNIRDHTFSSYVQCFCSDAAFMCQSEGPASHLFELRVWSCLSTLLSERNEKWQMQLFLNCFSGKSCFDSVTHMLKETKDATKSSVRQLYTHCRL